MRKLACDIKVCDFIKREWGGYIEVTSVQTSPEWTLIKGIAHDGDWKSNKNLPKSLSVKSDRVFSTFIPRK